MTKPLEEQTLALTASEWQWLHAEAAARNSTVTAVVREAIMMWIFIKTKEGK